MAILEPLENFSGGANGAQVSNTTTNFDAMSAGGTPANLIHSNEQFLPGLNRSMKGFGTGYQYGRWTTPSHTRHRRRFSAYVTQLPPAGTSRILHEVLVGDGTSIAAQVRLSDSGVLVGRNVQTAVATTAVVPMNAWFDYEVDLDGAGDLTLKLYTGANRATQTPTSNVSGALTAINFSESRLGNVTSTTGGCTVYHGYASDLTTSEVPTAYADPAPPPSSNLGSAQLMRLVAGVPTEFEVLRRTAGVATLMATDRRAPTTAGSVDTLLRPSEGCWWGAETPIQDGTGSTLQGLFDYEGFCGGRTPDFLHFYHKDWNGQLSASQLNQINRPGKKKPFVMHNWKVSSTHTWPQITAGQADAKIDACAAGLRARTDRFFLIIWHEPEDNIIANGGTQGTAAEYVAMYTYVVDRLAAQGVARASVGGRAVLAPNYMGWRDYSALYPTLFPASSKFDWVFYDPYALNPTRFPDPRNMFNDVQGAWNGFYAYVTATFPGVPIGIGEWGVNHWPATDGFTEAQEAAFYDALATRVATEFPMVKAMNHWHGDTIGEKNRHYQVYGRPIAAAALARAANAAHFNKVDVSAIP